MSGQHHQAIKNQSTKRTGTIEGFWTKTVASPPERKNKGKKLTNNLASTPTKK